MLSDFYHSTDWYRFRKSYLAERIARDGELVDDYTGRPILHDYDAVLHHVNPLTEENYMDASVALNPDNIMLLTHVSHNRIHEKGGGKRHSVYLVWGAPKSGKTRWTHENASQGDLICEIERLYQAIGADAIEGRYKAVAWKLWDTLIDCIRTRYGKWDNAYVVGTFPYMGERERMIQLLGAEEVHIDTDEATCLSRCITEQEEYYVKDWFGRADL